MFSMYQNNGSNNYNINSVTDLENSAGALASYNQAITNNVSSLEYVMKAVQANWENENGQDLQSTIQNLNDAIAVLENEIQPLLKNYVENLYNIANETKSHQRASIF